MDKEPSQTIHFGGTHEEIEDGSSHQDLDEAYFPRFQKKRG